ncbi:DUF1566 domain-containing protein [Candidatus Sulfurimonas baltica]|uniref:DUF1566 domain-containing protein n=1 Tax=Candidatus Sulfurimonas baltica TaxID=2740404 RepID=A0A7S7RNC8_9BACT|nr:DUF1566 domain-containing protein [Candidatus Sulfurimonas baltica]QOY52303.1 DUF1566 domain-containing protein [Candidatus Sulfurimonas baltica]
MILKLFLFILPLTLFSSEMVWSGDVSGELSQAEYDKVIKDYVDKKYPEIVEAWATFNNGLMWQDNNGLMWQDNEDVLSTMKNWSGAKQYCEDLTLVGFDDWRLPNIDELKSIVDKNRTPAIKKEFKNTISNGYWSSTTNASNTARAWNVYFSNGGQYYYGKASNFYVRCVRAGQ